MRHDQPTADDEHRRQFWRQMMDDAHAFMMQVRQCPVTECGEPVVPLKEVAAKANVEVLFSTTPFAGAHERLFYLRAGLVESFLGAARAMNAHNWALKVEDAYRTRTMQTALALSPSILEKVFERVRWECMGEEPSPELLFRRLTVLVATVPNIATHMSASALDVSVVDKSTGLEVNRGGPYLEMSENTPMQSPFLGQVAEGNRQQISAIMREYGFAAYPYEFWHYSNGDAIAVVLDGKQPAARYGAVDVEPRSGHVRPIVHPHHWLVTAERLQSILDKLRDHTNE